MVSKKYLDIGEKQIKDKDAKITRKKLKAK